MATLPIGVGAGAMREDALSKAERYREAANKYSELANGPIKWPAVETRFLLIRLEAGAPVESFFRALGA